MTEEQMIKEIIERRRQWGQTRDSDFDWLIGQAEKLEKLQEQTLYSDFINRINELEKEIKCLKEERKENHGEQQHETHTILDRGAQ